MKSSCKRFFVKTMATTLSAISMVSVSSVAECVKTDNSNEKTAESTEIIQLPGFKSLIFRPGSANTHPSSGNSSETKNILPVKDFSETSAESSTLKKGVMGISEMFESSRRALRNQVAPTPLNGENVGSEVSNSSAVSVPPACPVSKELTDARKSCEKARNDAKRAQENLNETEKDFKTMESLVKIARENRNKAENEKINAQKKVMAAAMTEQEALTRQAHAKSQVEKARSYLKKTMEAVRIQSIKLKEVEKSLNPKTSVVLYSQRKLEQHTQALIADNKKELDEIKEMSEKLHQSEINKSKANEMARHMVISQGNNMIASINHSSLGVGVSNLSLGIWDHTKIIKGLDIEITMANRFFEPYWVMKRFVSPFNVFRISFDGKNAICTFVNGATHAVKRKPIVIPIERLIDRLFRSGYVSCINCTEGINTTNSNVVSVNFSPKDLDSKEILLSNGSRISLSSVIKNIRSIEVVISTANSKIKSIEDLESFFME